MHIFRKSRYGFLLALTLLSGAAASVQAADEQFEAWTAKVQTTYIWQTKPGFGALYSGQNSLSANREKSYTFTTTAYLGLRPWTGGELYLDPELTQGVALSNVSGLAGFPNGEVTKVSGPNPKVYRQRLFLRQTWNFGGGQEQVESDLNQMAGGGGQKPVCPDGGQLFDARCIRRQHICQGPARPVHELG